VPSDPSAESSGPVAIAYYGSYSAWEYCVSVYDCWYDYVNSDVNTPTLSVLVNDRQSAALLHEENATLNCDYYSYSYTCTHTGSFVGTIGWAAGARATIAASMASDAGLLEISYSFNPNITVTPDAQRDEPVWVCRWGSGQSLRSVWAVPHSI
jgi:hypothetical protein